MPREIGSERKNVWPYAIWPPVILNVGGALVGARQMWQLRGT
jgi:hypothetical protein